MAEKISKAELARRLSAHRDWVQSGGERGERAELSGVFLGDADLIGAFLEQAMLENADLEGVNLSGANLKRAGLAHANLRTANLQDAVLDGADLRGAALHRANLHGARLKDANLEQAWLIYAHLEGADLRGANLKEANLLHANLRDADLSASNLREAKFSGTILSGAVLKDAKIHGAQIRMRSMDREARLSLRGVDGWTETRRSGERRPRAVAAIAVVIVLAGGVTYVAQDQTLLSRLRALVGKTGGGETDGAVVATPKPRATQGPRVDRNAMAEAAAEAAAETKRQAKRQAEEAEAKRLAAERRARQAVTAEALARRQEQARARQQAEAAGRKEAEEIANLRSRERAELEKTGRALRSAELEARTLADQAQLSMLRARDTVADEEAKARRYAEDARKLVFEAESSRRAAEEARLAAIKAVERDDEDGWRRLEADRNAYRQAAARAEAEAKAAVEAAHAARKRAEEAAKLANDTASLRQARADEAQRMAAEAARAEADAEVARERETLARRIAGIRAMNAWHVVRKWANVRDGPSVATDRIGNLKGGTKVLVTGRITTANWYRVELESGRIGYVFGTLLEKSARPGE